MASIGCVKNVKRNMRDFESEVMLSEKVVLLDCIDVVVFKSRTGFGEGPFDFCAAAVSNAGKFILRYLFRSTVKYS